MTDDTPHKKYLGIAADMIGFHGQTVLEVGGCSPPELVVRHKPRSWTSVNLHPGAVERFNESAKRLSLTDYSATLLDVAVFQPTQQFDRIYSINSFEHIGNLEGAFATMFRALRDDGYLFTLFGPIWSSDVGHHLSLSTDKGTIHFGDGILDPWEHLTSTPEAIHAKVKANYGDSVADRAVEFIFTYPDINRFFEHQYLAILEKSGFTPVMIIRNRKGRAPAIPGATNTREFVMVLKKGRAGLLERATAYVKFVASYLRHRSA